jgi:hypothetical protein
MNQRLNHLVLLYKKCNCIIMSLNTYDKNVDIIWHCCIISQIKLNGFWKRSALTNMKKDVLKYMINRFCLLCSVFFSKQWLVYAAGTNSDVCARNYLYPVFLLIKTQPHGFYQWICIKDTPLPDW